MLCGDVKISQCVVWDVWIRQCVVWGCVDKSVCCVEVCG